MTLFYTKTHITPLEQLISFPPLGVAAWASGAALSQPPCQPQTEVAVSERKV